MAISSHGSAWNPLDEHGTFKAVKSVTFEAGTEEDAVFLARLWGCVRRGRPDGRLASLVDRLFYAFEPEPGEPSGAREGKG